MFRSATASLALAIVACELPGDAALMCEEARRIATLPADLDEVSGIAASRSHPGIFWVHNDSEGSPSLYAIDEAGALVAELELPAAGTQVDWEDIALGPCPAGECLYIGDIGDNLHEREDRAILRLPEPQPRDGTARGVERFPIRYPDGPRDAEALFIMPDTSLFIVSKGRSGPITVYRYPPPLRAGERVELEVVQRLSEGLVQLPDLVTGASATPDGRTIAIRTYSFLQLYRLDGDTLAPLWPGRGYDLHALAEPQGEGIELLTDGTVWLVSETGPQRRPAPLSRLRCRLP
jgi:hypothetical protein